jgi:hypothetical protein
MRRVVSSAALAAALLVSTAACGGGGSSKPKQPTSDAQLEIVAPTVGAVVKGPDVRFAAKVTGGVVVPASQTTGPLRGDQGHIHVSVDGNLVTMAYSATTTLHGLTKGAHSIEAEYVATNHLPFANRIIASVTFTVK